MLQVTLQSVWQEGIGVTIPTLRMQDFRSLGGRTTHIWDMDTTRRGNYESGSDYVLEYGELRFTFNERDFTERVEQAAIKLDFVPGPLAEEEREDLVNLAVNGEVIEPSSTLGEHINSCWARLVGASERSLVHWLRRLVFRGAWLDQRVMEGELEVVFDDATHTFGYAQPDRDYEVIELSPEPSWAEVAYRV
jgi:hypothetical protein